MPRPRAVPRMTAGHFELLAHIVRTFTSESLSVAEWRTVRAELADHTADMLAESNVRFDRPRFIAACLRDS